MYLQIFYIYIIYMTYKYCSFQCFYLLSLLFLSPSPYPFALSPFPSLSLFFHHYPSHLPLAQYLKTQDQVCPSHCHCHYHSAHLSFVTFGQLGLLLLHLYYCTIIIYSNLFAEFIYPVVTGHGSECCHNHQFYQFQFSRSSSLLSIKELSPSRKPTTSRHGVISS